MKKLLKGFLLRWLRKELTIDFKRMLKELKNGETSGFKYILHGGGSSYQRRKQKRLIMKNIVANFFNYPV